MSRKSASTTRRDRGESREDRLKSALKANLARRKAQMRARADDTKTEPGHEVAAETSTDTDKE